MTARASELPRDFAAAFADLPSDTLRRDDPALVDAAKAALRRAFGRRRLQKRPLVDVHLLRVLMGWFTALVLYALIWWTVLFAVLARSGQNRWPTPNRECGRLARCTRASVVDAEGDCDDVGRCSASGLAGSR